MTERRRIEVFSAGCPICEETVRTVREEACGDCEVVVVDLHQPEGADRARELGVESAPAVAVGGELAGCCSDGGPALQELREAGLGRPVG